MTEQQVQATVSFLQIREATGATYNNAKTVYQSMLHEATIDRECGWVLHLNSALCIIEKELVSMGTITATILTPRQTFRKALINNARGVIIVHNHPRGDTSPSDEDITCCKKLHAAADILDVDILDFIIISTKGYYSFADERVGGFT